MNTSLKSGYRILILLTGTLVALSASAELKNIPDRVGSIPATTDGIPHMQTELKVVPKIKAELLHRVSMVSGIEFRATIVSIRGTTGFWLDADLPLANPQVIPNGREFAHLHPDGSLHAPLPPEVAVMAIGAGWAIQHPWATQRAGWEGFVMIYTPTTEEELEVVFDLVMESFRYVTGVDAISADG